MAAKCVTSNLEKIGSNKLSLFFRKNDKRSYHRRVRDVDVEDRSRRTRGWARNHGSPRGWGRDLRTLQQIELKNKTKFEKNLLL